MKSSTICTYGRAKLAILLIILFSIVYNIPRFFEISWSVVPAQEDASLAPLAADAAAVVNQTLEDEGGGSMAAATNLTKVIIQPTELRSNSTYISIYITWMYLVFMYVFPFGGLSVLNLLIYLDVRRSNARQSTLSSNEKKELRLAMMLMTVVVVFQICNILPLIVNILEVFKGEDEDGADIKELTPISNMLVTLNSSVNIFIYIIMGEKFKRQFLQMLVASPCLASCQCIGDYLIKRANEDMMDQTGYYAATHHRTSTVAQDIHLKRSSSGQPPRRSATSNEDDEEAAAAGPCCIPRLFKRRQQRRRRRNSSYDNNTLHYPIRKQQPQLSPGVSTIQSRVSKDLSVPPMTATSRETTPNHNNQKSSAESLQLRRPSENGLTASDTRSIRFDPAVVVTDMGCESNGGGDAKIESCGKFADGEEDERTPFLAESSSPNLSSQPSSSHVPTIQEPASAAAKQLGCSNHSLISEENTSSSSAAAAATSTATSTSAAAAGSCRAVVKKIVQVNEFREA